MHGKIWLILGTLLLALTGCLTPFTRQSSSKDGDKDLDVPIIASVTDFEREKLFNSGQMQISGVGLVCGLDGTGDCPQGQWRAMLEQEMRRQKVEHIREILESRDNALVLVSATLHSGMRKGEPIDVDVALPPNSRASSLRGGVLMECSLRNYATARTGASDFSVAEQKLLAGDVMARAGGTLLVGLGDPESASPLTDKSVRPTRARIWEGGVLLADRPFYFVIKKDDKPAHVASAVADRLNGLFREDADKLRMQNNRLQNSVAQRLNQKFDVTPGRGEVARPFKEAIALSVPFVYCLNPERYLRVSRLVPLSPCESPAYTGAEHKTPACHPRYLPRLAQMLLDPKDTVRAALRLEALGQESVPTLKTGLTSPHPLVCFTSAEALTYLGSPAGAAELGRLAEVHTELRYWCLLALANLNEAVCRNVLTDLLDRPDPELRYGAFYALRLLSQTEADGRNGIFNGQRFNDSFSLHRVAPRSAPLVHLSMTRRAEIVLFGNDIQLRAPTAISAGTEFIIAPGPDANQCVVSRTRLREETKKLEATSQIDDILRKMAALGAQYPDVVDFLRKSDQRGCLSCPLRIDALPAPMPVDALAEAGRDANFLRGQ